MKKPKFRLTNIKYHQGREFYGINFDVYINGVKCMHVFDSGDGGCMSYYNEYSKDTVKNEKIKFNIKLMDEYINSLSDYEFESGGRIHTMKYDRDTFFNELLEQIEREKKQKKIDKLCKTSIVIGNKSMYAYVNFKKPLEQVNKAVLTKHAWDLHTKYCTKKGSDFKFLNKNLTALGIVI